MAILAGIAVAAIILPVAFAAESAPPRIEVGRSALVVKEVVGKFSEANPAPIKLDDQVLFDEDISTGDDAKTIVRFRDGSTFAMGPDAVVRIDRFVFNPDESVSQKSVTVTQGVFRYISGFAAKRQNTEIKTISGSMSIRGSVVSGIVTPGVPPLLFVAQGTATFTNSAGSVDVQAGQAIAVPSATTAPINPAELPPAVLAQTLQVIQPLLPSPQVQSSLTQPGAQVLSRQGQLNLVPAALQQAQQSAAAPAPMTIRAGTGTGSLANALPLLTQANSVGLLNGSQTSPTPQQQAFLDQVNQAAPQAQAQIAQTLAAANDAHSATALTATISVAQSLSAATPSQTAAAGGLPAGAVTPTPVAVPSADAPTGVMPTAPRGVPETPQAVQAMIASPGTNIVPTVISVAEANPAMSQEALTAALRVLGAGTGAAASLITSFAQDISNTADCDTDAASKMAAALDAILSDPEFSSLGTNDPTAFALAQAAAESLGITGFSATGSGNLPSPAFTASTGGSPVSPPATNFGNFGSIAGTGASTSPAI